MKCPYCNVAFHSDTRSICLGKNGRSMKVHLYFQTCPECKEIIMGVRHTDSYILLKQN